jgi:hypothetical protein
MVKIIGINTRAPGEIKQQGDAIFSSAVTTLAAIVLVGMALIFIAGTMVTLWIANVSK